MSNQTLIMMILAQLSLIGLLIYIQSERLLSRQKKMAASTRQEVTTDEPALDGKGLPIHDSEGRVISRRTVSKTTTTTDEDDDSPIPKQADPIPTKHDKRAG